MDEHRPRWTKSASFFIHFRPVAPLSVCEMVVPGINARFSKQKSRTAGASGHWLVATDKVYALLFHKPIAKTTKRDDTRGEVPGGLIFLCVH